MNRGLTAFMAAGILADLLFSGCGFIRRGHDISCSERCRYDYQFCEEESPGNSAHITFTIHPEPEDGDHGVNPLNDSCTERYKKCVALCNPEKIEKKQ